MNGNPEVVFIFFSSFFSLSQIIPIIKIVLFSFSKVRFAFKLKSSNNEHYRVNPVFGFVEPGAAAQVEVIRQNGPPKGDDKLEICFAGAPPDAGDAKAIFPPGSSGEFKVDVPMAAA
ncbi:unnamed protein product [Meloidogyne enterolobii]